MPRRILLTLLALAVTAGCAGAPRHEAAHRATPAAAVRDLPATRDGAPATAPAAAPAPAPTPAPSEPAALAGPPSSSPACPGGTRVVHRMIDGLAREYLVALPSGSAGGAVPLLVLLHGYGRSIGAIADATGLLTAAGRAGMAVAVPQASGDPAHWSIPGLDGPDDVAFVRTMLDDVESHGCVDPAREYVAGFSNGAGLAAVLTCRLPGRFAGVALVAGAGLVEPCAGSPAVPVLAFHGAADGVVPVAGGPVLGGRLRARPLGGAMRAWATHDGCRQAGIVAAVAGGVHETWGGCREGASVDLWTVAGVGHHWPRGRVDATAIVVDRFAHPSGDQSSLASR